MSADRDIFRETVFERDGHVCVVCGAPAVDAHHLMERRLWDYGGYVPDNGVSVCEEHHLAAESGLITPAELRELAGIRKVLLPDHLYPDNEYDKWGNILTPDGHVIPGELFFDESVQKILDPSVKARVLMRFKYPRTYHLPWSPGATDDDRILKEIPWKGREVIVTEKMDGENTTLYRDYYHARSLDSGYHPSRNWVKNLHSQFAFDIPAGWRLCGENLQAKHSIGYGNLPSYFMLFSIWNERNECLSWDATVEWAELLDLPVVPVLMREVWTDDTERKLRKLQVDGSFSDESEGYVVRVADSFAYRDFRNSLGKYVREGNVDETRHHWARQQMVPNGLA